MISNDEAILLLRGLKEKTAALRVTMVTAGARCAFEGVVSEISPAEVLLYVPPVFKVSCAMLISLEGARFEYGDTREAPERQREALSEKFIAALTILLPNKTRVVITELNR